jgi:hypothetical protein
MNAPFGRKYREMDSSSASSHFGFLFIETIR